MKKVLISMLALAAAFAANADVTVFKAQAAPMCRYDGTADQTVEAHSGFCFRFHSDTKQRVDVNLTQAGFVEKALAADRVELWGRHMDGVNSVSCDHVTDGSFRWFFDRSMYLTPADGLTITKVRIKLNRPESPMPAVCVVEPDGAGVKILDEFVWTAADSTLTLDCNYNKPIFLLNMGENYERKKGTLRPIFFEVTTTGTTKQCAVPEFSVKRPMLGASETVELTCSTPDAKIYYTIDNDGKWDGTAVNGALRKHDPTTASTLYTGPITLDKNAIIRAIAVKDGMTNSFIAYKEYYTMPDYDEEAVFDFTDHTSIKDENGNQIAIFNTYPVVDTQVSSSTVEKVSIVTNPAVCKDATITGTITNAETGDGCDITLSNSFGGVVELRPLNTSTVYISVPDDKYLTAVLMEASVCNDIALSNGIPGTWANGFTTTCQKMWTYEGEDVYEISLDINASSQYVDRFFVYYKNIESGVQTVSVDANAPAEYFNLHGQRVANPAKGIYIKRQGNKVSKVIL